MAGKSVRLSRRLVLFALAIEFCVSANMLTWIGVPYVTEGGIFPLKIHPGTYLLCVAFCIHCAGQARPNAAFWAAIGQNGFLLVYISALLICLVYELLTTGRGNLVVLLDTFLPAGLVAAIVQSAPQSELSMLRRLLQWAIALNAALALGEAVLHARMVPLYLNDAEYHAPVEEFRPTALYDHPLTGGVATMIGFALPPQRLWLRSAYSLLLMGAILAFGGRAALAAVVCAWTFLACLDLVSLILRRDPRAACQLIAVLIAFSVGAALWGVAIYAGLGARLIGHLYWDPSAQVRLAQWNLLGELNPSQLLFGTARTDLLALLSPLWLSYGVEVIENFWLLMFASLGATGFLVFLFGFVSLLCWCWNRTGLRGRVLLVTFLLVASSSNSLGRKSTLLVVLVAAVSCIPVGCMRAHTGGHPVPGAGASLGVT